MKKITLIICYLNSLVAFGQNLKVEFDAKNWQPPYTLSMPKGWDVERFPIPIEFASKIPYAGVEDIRFTPRWANVKSDEYWTYAFLWYLDNFPKMNKKIIQENLKAYYTGLVERNIEPRKIPANKIIPTKTSFKRIKTINNDLQTYSGTIEMLDYMEQKPITLNCIVHVKRNREKIRLLFFINYHLSHLLTMFG
ncbi:MAG: hypothetical protein WKG06_47025 [Segetibacter sp.]